MTINHDKKAIFINVPKTARTYISRNLVENYGFVEYLQAKKNHNEEYNIINENIFGCPFANKIDGILQYYKYSDELNKLMYMDMEKWDTYYKFTFVRNPYDRCVSGYNYIVNLDFNKKLLKKYNDKSNNNIKIKPISFNNFYSNKKYMKTQDYVYIHTFQNQTKNLIDIDNTIKFDYIGKYENLEEDFIKILKQIGFSDDEISHNIIPVNVGTHKKFDEYYDSNEILTTINNLFIDDFKNFGYNMYENLEDFKSSVNS